MLSSKVDEVLANVHVHYTYIICDSRIHIFQTNSVHLMKYELSHLTTSSLIKEHTKSCIEQARNTREIDASNKHMTHQGLHSNDQ